MQVRTRHAVLELVRRDRARTRRDLSGITGMSRSAVAQLVAELVAEGLLAEEAGGREVRLGRPATRLSLVPRRGLVGAVEIGHGHVGVALGDLHAKVLDRYHSPRPGDWTPRESLAAALAALDELLARRGARRADLRALGIGVPHPVLDGTVMPIGDAPAWIGMRPADVVAMPGHAAVVVDNVSDLAAWAEYVTAGSSAGALLYIGAGDGLGGALVVDGEIFTGRHGVSGEVGHVVVPGCTLPCRCGRVGCLDALVTAASAPGASELERRVAGEAVGMMGAQVAGFLDPDLVVLGGTLGADETFAAVAQAAFRRSVPSPRVAFRPALLRSDAPLSGALDRATQEAWLRA